MLSFSGSDILKLLEQIPVWKTLTSLPKRVKELEDRVAALETKKPKAAIPCPLCEADMKVTKVERDRYFGPLGVQQHTLTCPACGHTEERQVDPGKA